MLNKPLDSDLTHHLMSHVPTVFRLVMRERTRGVIDPLYHCRHNGGNRQYEWDRGIMYRNHRPLLIIIIILICYCCCSKCSYFLFSFNSRL